MVTTFPVIHGHLVVPDDLEALGKVLGALEMLDNCPTTESVLFQARLALVETLALMAVAGG